MEKWWNNHPWRQIQTNLREIDMQDINSGIIANYQTDLEFETVNPCLQGDRLAKIIEKCHEANIKVIARLIKICITPSPRERRTRCFS